MDVRLSPVQEALRGSVSTVVGRLGPRAVAQLDDLERSEKLEAAIVASGGRELRVDEAEGTRSRSGHRPQGAETALVLLLEVAGLLDG